MTTTFSSLGLNDNICRAVKEQGYETPTPIQEQAIPYVVAGRDMLGCAQTGTGKTAAFALPILHRLAADTTPTRGIRALVLTPTRELALQIQENFEAYSRHLKLKSVVIFGGVGIEPQKRALRANPDIVIATPGRFIDLKNQGFLDLRSLKIFVLDEADRMLDMGFIHDVKKIIRFLPERRQNLLFSATMPNDIRDLVQKLLHNPAKVEVTPVSSTSELVSQFVYHVDKPNKRFLLLHVLDTKDVTRALVFTRTKHVANRVAEFLSKNGVIADAIHGNKSQTARQRALENFRRGKSRVLVASDIAARGIDIDEVSHVINYDMPNVPETYVHRIGRTGRAAATGVAISFVEKGERSYLTDVERLTKKKVTVEDEHPYPQSDAPAEAPEPQRRFQPKRNKPQGRNNHQRRRR